jgi:prepilin-type N-terminal cleavage/methylation domain-containing protein
MLKKDEFDQNGFTLVELLLTIIVLGIAIVSIGGLYYALQISQVQTQHLDIATRAARSEIEDLRNNGYNSLVDGATIDFTSTLPPNLPSDKKGTVAISEPVSGLKRVDVTINYTDYGKKQSVELSSDIGVIGIGRGQ